MSDKNKFVFGVCNGCQFLTELQSILPGNEVWPKFTENKSGRFESRQSFVEVLDSNSLFFIDFIWILVENSTRKCVSSRRIEQV